MDMVGHTANGVRNAFQRCSFAPQVTIQIGFPGRFNQCQSVFGSPGDVVEQSPIGHMAPITCNYSFGNFTRPVVNNRAVSGSPVGAG